MGCSSRSVREYIEELSRVKLISYKRVGLGRTNIYTLLSIEKFLQKSKKLYEKSIEKYKNSAQKKTYTNNPKKVLPEKSSDQDVSKTSGQERHKSSDIIEEALPEEEIIISKNSNSSKFNTLEKKKEERISNNPISNSIDPTTKSNPSKERAGSTDLKSLLKNYSSRFSSVESSRPPKTNENSSMSKSPQRTKTIQPKASRQLTSLTKKISHTFNDEKHIASNIQQMKNILFALQGRGQDEDVLVNFAYRVEGLVKESVDEIRGSKMGYFYKTLKYELKLAEKPKL